MKAYAAIRHCADGYEYIDVTCISSCQQTVIGLIRKSQEETGPAFSNANPVVRVAMVEIKELIADGN